MTLFSIRKDCSAVGNLDRHSVSMLVAHSGEDVSLNQQEEVKIPGH